MQRSALLQCRLDVRVRAELTISLQNVRSSTGHRTRRIARRPRNFVIAYACVSLLRACRPDYCYFYSTVLNVSISKLVDPEQRGGGNEPNLFRPRIDQ